MGWSRIMNGPSFLIIGYLLWCLWCQRFEKNQNFLPKTTKSCQNRYFFMKIRTMCVTRLLSPTAQPRFPWVWNIARAFFQIGFFALLGWLQLYFCWFFSWVDLRSSTACSAWIAMQLTPAPAAGLFLSNLPLATSANVSSHQRWWPWIVIMNFKPCPFVTISPRPRTRQSTWISVGLRRGSLQQLKITRTEVC